MEFGGGRSGTSLEGRLASRTNLVEVCVARCGSHDLGTLERGLERCRLVFSYVPCEGVKEGT